MSKIFLDKNNRQLGEFYETADIVANPEATGEELDLARVKIGNTNYSIPRGDLYIFEISFGDSGVRFLSPIQLFEGTFNLETTVLSTEQLASLNAYIAYLQSQEPVERLKDYAVRRGVIGFEGIPDVTTQIPVMLQTQIADNVLTLTCWILFLELDSSSHTVSYASNSTRVLTIDLTTGQLGGNIQQGMTVNFHCTKIK